MFLRQRPKKTHEIDELRRAFHDAIASDAAIDPMQIAVLAMYVPLHALAVAPALLDRSWTHAIDDVLTQQVREPRAGERAARYDPAADRNRR